MSNSTNLLDQSSHFAFGKNWASYANLVTDTQVEEATRALQRLVGSDLKGKRVLDIGCGSGLHALAALRLGAMEVTSVDIDPDSVATARKMLEANAPDGNWRVLEKSVFDLSAADMGTFDVVYSWGVLHHTGDMYRALRIAASLVTAGGQFVFALYRYTRMCWFWSLEKRWYAKASTSGQALAQKLYVGSFRAACALTGRNFARYVADYKSQRGMDYYHDVHDWLGGWPYESISSAGVEKFMRELGLERMHSFGPERTTMGILGSGCNEYTYVRR